MVLRPSFTAAKSSAALEMGQEPAVKTSSKFPAAAEEFVAIASSTRRAAPLAEWDALGVPVEMFDMQGRRLMAKSVPSSNRRAILLLVTGCSAHWRLVSDAMEIRG